MNHGSSRTPGSDRNRLELLLFSIGSRQRFGINVLKVKEVLPCPPLTKVPQAHPAVCGVAHLRGEPLTVVNLARAVGRPSAMEEGQCGSIIITEFNRSIQGFLVSKVDRIVVCDWSSVLPPPAGSGLASYITGVTRIDDELIQVLDVERVLGEVVGEEEADPRAGVADHALDAVRGRLVLVVDDSTMARHQTAHTLDELGVEYLMARDGREALQMLRERVAEQGESGHVDMIISDIEMPEMDGYTLTREVRADAQLTPTYILLHTSLNGAINAELAGQAGADDVLTKFVPAELARAVVKGLTHQD